MIRKTKWIRYAEGSQLYVFRAEYGFDTKFAKKHNQEPHFSITGEGKSVNSRGGDGYFGTCHDKIVELLPKLKPLVRRHLCGMETGPMHYEAQP